MKYKNIREEELKNKIAQDYFYLYDCTRIIGNVDFCVSLHQNQKEIFKEESLLWAEAKQGRSDIYNSLVQLMITIGKARTFDKYLHPLFIGAFDFEKIAFIPFEYIHDIFDINDFNWNVTPSNHNTKEFKLLLERVKSILDKETLLYNYENDDKELCEFIKDNFVVGKLGFSKRQINKNNFISIYNKWRQVVLPTIHIPDWNAAKNSGIKELDFYLADLLSKENITFADSLRVVLEEKKYKLIKKDKNELGLPDINEITFTDGQKAHNQFWNIYERPPKEEYWKYILDRRDLLTPQKVREREGSFYTPKVWVDLSHKYLADTFGENWQEEYYIWDCAAGTGNLLAWLTNKHHIWASTLDKADVDIMRELNKTGHNLLEAQIFQFDFLNDDFSKLPKSLQDIINNPEERKKLIIYINPPYAEASDMATVFSGGENKTGVATEKKRYKEYTSVVGTAARELFIQFFMRIYNELPGVKLASFSTMKHISASNFDKFRNYFSAKYLNGFVCPANTFDNVSGNFPVGFLIWDIDIKNKIGQINSEVYDVDKDDDEESVLIDTKNFYPVEKNKYVIKWLRNYYDKTGDRIAYLRMIGTDMQHNRGVFFTSKPSENDFKKHLLTNITKDNIIPMSIYLAIRHCIKRTWLNDRDQFLYPNDSWKVDKEFQSDCLAFVLFHGQNKISYKDGTNYWIPFTEKEVDSKEKFTSSFMTDYMKGKIKTETINQLFKSNNNTVQSDNKIQFSTEAEEVINAGRELWKYYHQQPNCNANASYYDIREFFQGRDDNRRMNNNSTNETYNQLISKLRDKMKVLASKIELKVYEYEFLKR